MDNSATSRLITIAIPTYNRAAYLCDTINSAINQTYSNLQIIISDNCSEDNTPEVVKLFTDQRIQYFRQPENLGMVGNWNFCLDKAKGDFFLILSDDDLLVPEAIEKMAACLECGSFAFVYSRFLYIDEIGSRVGIARSAPQTESGSDFITNSLLHRREVMPSALLHRTADATIVGGYQDVGTVTDLVFRFDLASNSKVCFVDEVLMHYRVHPSSLSSGAGAVLRSLTLFYEMALDEGCFLYGYAGMIRQYVTKDVRNKALRGQFNNSGVIDEDTAVKLLCRVDRSYLRLVIFKIYKMKFFRVSFKLLKKTRSILRNFSSNSVEFL